MGYTTIVNNIAISNGDKGPYDSKINNASVRYGRNAIANHLSHMLSGGKSDLSNLQEKDLKSDTFEKKMAQNEAVANNNTPNFEYKYLPGNVSYENIDKMALLGAAYEEMGQRTEASVDELNKQIQVSFGPEFSAEALDLNGDKKVDVSEFAASVLLGDMAAKNPQELDRKNITGAIGSKGELNMLAYFHNKNKAVASSVLGEIHKIFGLEDAKKEFEKDPNNLVKLNILA